MTPCLLCADAESIPGLQAPRTPAYNHSAVGHVPFIAEEPPLSVADEVRLDKQFNDRWRTLLSVDDLVGAVVGALESTGLAKNTCAGPAHLLLVVVLFLPCSLADEIALRRHLLQQRSVRDTPRPLPLVCAFPDSSACWQWVPPWALPHRAGEAAPLRLRYPRASL